MTVAERIARIVKECSGVWAQSGISSWERDRLEEWGAGVKPHALKVNASGAPCHPLYIGYDVLPAPL